MAGAGIAKKFECARLQGKFFTSAGARNTALISRSPGAVPIGRRRQAGRSGKCRKRMKKKCEAATAKGVFRRVGVESVEVQKDN